MIFINELNKHFENIEAKIFCSIMTHDFDSFNQIYSKRIMIRTCQLLFKYVL